MDQLFHFPQAIQDNPAVQEWLADHSDDPLGQLAHHWFSVMRQCGDDVNELMHDGYATACVTSAAFAYVGIFKAHVNVGFFRGAELPDMAGILQGTGKLMRHVKLKPGSDPHNEALTALITTAYIDMHARLS